MKRRVVPGIYSLAVTYPQLVPEWHSTRNDLTPDEVTPQSSRKVWWQCLKGHEWQAAISNRSRSGTGCPYCSGNAVVPGETDLASLHPDLSTQWHPDLNDGSPSECFSNSHRKVWWLCPVGHSWQSSPNARVTHPACPFCSGRRVWPGETDLGTVNPRLAQEWHPTKNGKLLPSQISPGSSRKAWWLCSAGHEWEATVKNRHRGSGCPKCGNKIAVSGQTDLATLWPDVAAEWHPSRNGELRPELLLPASSRKVWWQCLKGHEWQTAISNRTRPGRGTGCPFCAGRRVAPGDNDLTTLNPDLAAQWHPTLNGDLTAAHVTSSSGRRVWWQCGLGHEWRALVSLRNLGTGCPYCSGNQVLAGFNDLASKYREVAAEWHPTKNGDLHPDQVLAAAKRKVWWLCSLDSSHEWQATVQNRTGRESGCPSCAKHGFDASKQAWLYLLENDLLDLFQIGITNELEVRLRFHALTDWILRDVEGPMSGDLARGWERSILAALKRRRSVRPMDAGLERFNGHTESWTRASLPVESLAELRAMVRADEE